MFVFKASITVPPSLSLTAEDMSTPNAKEGYQAAGVNSILPKEHGAKFVSLPIIKNFEKDVSSADICVKLVLSQCWLSWENSLKILNLSVQSEFNL